MFYNICERCACFGSGIANRRADFSEKPIALKTLSSPCHFTFRPRIRERVLALQTHPLRTSAREPVRYLISRPPSFLLATQTVDLSHPSPPSLRTNQAHQNRQGHEESTTAMTSLRPKGRPKHMKPPIFRADCRRSRRRRTPLATRLSER